MRKLWTKEKEKILEDNYLLLPYAKIAEKVKKTPEAVRMKALNMRLKNKYQIEYAVYFGDEHAFTGNKHECIEKLGINDRNFNNLLCKTGVYDNGIHIVNLGRWEIGG